MAKRIEPFEVLRLKVQARTSRRYDRDCAVVWPVDTDAASWLEMSNIAEFFPAIDVQAPDADPLAIVGLTPHALVPALTVPTNDAVQGARRAITLQFRNEVRNDIWQWERLDLLARDPALRQRRRNHVARRAHGLGV